MVRLLAAALLIGAANAFVAPSQAFHKAMITQQHQSQTEGKQTGVRSLMARSGPEMGRKQAKRDFIERQRAMAEFNAEIETTPVFQVFAATEKMKGLWMPIAAFKADNVAKGVVDASLQEGFAANMFKGVYKAQVETAVSKAIYDNEKRLRDQGASMHATLKNCPRDQWVWGFKILYKPMQDKLGKNQQPTVVTRDMAKSLFDKFKDNVSKSFSLSLDESVPAKPAPPAPKQKGGKKKKAKGGKDGAAAATSAEEKK